MMSYSFYEAYQCDRLLTYHDLQPGMYCHVHPSNLYIGGEPINLRFLLVLSRGFGNPAGTQVRVWRVGVRVWNG